MGKPPDCSGECRPDRRFRAVCAREGQLREPQRWLADIRCPTFVFEGTKDPANIASLRALQKQSTNARLHFAAINGENHFSLIAPLLERFARAIRADTVNQATFVLP